MRHRLAVALVVVALALPLLLPAGGAAPVVTTIPTQPMVQKLVDNLLAVPQVKEAFKDGQALRVNIRNAGERPSTGLDHVGTIEGGKAAMQPIPAGSARDGVTHVITIDAAAAVSLANAFDPTNTGLLILKGGHASLASTDAATQIGFNALLKTPASSGLTPYTLEVGRTIQYGSCSGTLETSATEGYFRVTLCGTVYVVNALGGVNGKVSNKKLADHTCPEAECAGRSLSARGSPTIWDACWAFFGSPPLSNPMPWRLRMSECLKNESEGRSS